MQYSMHILMNEFQKLEMDAILFIDVENAFNSLNRELAPKIAEIFCPLLQNALVNSYKHTSNLYVNKRF